MPGTRGTRSISAPDSYIEIVDIAISKNLKLKKYILPIEETLKIDKGSLLKESSFE